MSSKFIIQDEDGKVIELHEKSGHITLCLLSKEGTPDLAIGLSYLSLKKMIDAHINETTTSSGHFSIK